MAARRSGESRVCSRAVMSQPMIEHVEEPGPEWDAYAEAQPGAQLGHAAAWARVLREGYGIEPHYLAARAADGSLQGILPLFRFRTLTGARELVSIPFHDGAGVLAGEEATAAALVRAAGEAASALGARAVELRQVGACPGVPAPHGETGRVNLVLPLEADEEAQWKAVGAKVRNQTRKAEKQGLHAPSWSPEALLRGFYGPFAFNMRDLGTPAHAIGFYRAAAQAFGDRLRFVVAADGERSVGGLVAIEYARRVTVTWASTLRSERARCPNNLIYWEAIRWAVERGSREFDFGRSPVGEGTYRFKKGWGAEDRELAWVRLSPDGSPVPLAPPGENPTLARLSRWWMRLPLGLATALGPRIRRFLAS
jgi:FemAB-related protein (PEP-CTERM system-associated)